MRPAKRAVVILMATLVGLALAVPAMAFDAKWYQNFVQNKAFKCIHPKSKIQKIEVVSAPKVDKDVETARIKVFYKGWIKKHQMVLEVSTTTIGGETNAKVKVLSDTGTLKRLKCALTQGWQPIK